MRRALFALLVIAPLAGCPDDKTAPDATDTNDTNETPDTTGDTTPDTTADTTETVDPDVAPDTGPDTDSVTPGGTVAGTALEGVEVVWSAPMTLCSDWSEGASLADEKARKVIIEMPAQTRTTLDEAALASGRFEDLAVRKSPFASGLFRPSSAAGTSSVTHWQILDASGGNVLGATVEHTLEGKAGTLFEHYNVARHSGTPTALEVGPGSYELTFGYRPWGSTLQPAPLVRCGGDPSFEDAVSVVHATSDKDWVTLLRFWRTAIDEGFSAGSYPVAITGHRIVTSDAPWWPTNVRGFWSHTYVAEHHNWNDSTEVDLAGDLGHWHATLRDRLPETEPISKVTVEGLLEFGEGAVTVERMTDAGPTTRRYTVANGRDFHRVDAGHLRRTHATDCDGEAPTVWAAGGSDHLVQLLFCDASSPEVIGLIPVIWGSDPTVIAQRFDPHTSAAGEWAFTIGTRTVTAYTRPDDHIELLVVDTLGEIVMQSYEKRGPLSLPEPWFSPVRAETIVGGEPLSFELERIWVTFGVGKSQIWAPTHFTVSYAGTTWHIESWDRMDYTNTHHNWEDELSAEADDGTVLHWKTSFFDGTPNILTITDAAGEPILPATVLR